MSLKKIIIIDDDEELCEELEEILSEEGYKISIARDGLSGKKMIEKNHYDVVILDLKLPVLNGFEVLQFVRSKNKPAKVVVISGRPMNPDTLTLDKTDAQLMQEEKILKMADMILNKPFDPQSLLGILRDILGIKPAQEIQGRR